MTLWEYMEVLADFRSNPPVWLPDDGDGQVLRHANAGMVVDGQMSKSPGFAWYSIAEPLNELGSRQWELVSLRESPPQSDNWRLVFKRPSR